PARWDARTPAPEGDCAEVRVRQGCRTYANARTPAKKALTPFSVEEVGWGRDANGGRRAPTQRK
ncbi:MAG: hypothetical protein ACE5O2_02155, partial [Armatimonadota bacterium]